LAKPLRDCNVQLLLEAVRMVAEGGTPRGIEPSYATLEASEAVLPTGGDWRGPGMRAGSEIEQTI
jgi:hypothetical protein